MADFQRVDLNVSRSQASSAGHIAESAKTHSLPISFEGLAPYTSRCSARHHEVSWLATPGDVIG
jgi:hypothetical protein